MGIGLGSFQIGGFNLGSVVEGISDAIGLPEGIGDLASGAANCLSGNIPGMIEDGFDLAENILTDPGAQKGQASRNWQSGADGPDGAFGPVRATPAGAVDPAPPEPTCRDSRAPGAKDLLMELSQALEDVASGKLPVRIKSEDCNKSQMEDYEGMIHYLRQLLKLYEETMTKMANRG